MPCHRDGGFVPGAAPAIPPELFGERWAGRQRATLDDVLAAVVALRHDVAALRLAVDPPASALITGREAIAALAALRRR